jgi:hypothetical protein
VIEEAMRIRITGAIISVLLIVQFAYACSFAKGYFYQVTALRGTIVGVNRGDPRHQLRWLRQQVTRGNVDLTLYEYAWPAKLRDLKLIKKTKTDNHGKFDFGDLREGHYTLQIEDPAGHEDLYDIQIYPLTNKTISVTIDISPVFPDCTGGHEFIVTSQ